MESKWKENGEVNVKCFFLGVLMVVEVVSVGSYYYYTRAGSITDAAATWMQSRASTIRCL